MSALDFLKAFGAIAAVSLIVIVASFAFAALVTKALIAMGMSFAEWIGLVVAVWLMLSAIAARLYCRMAGAK